MELPTENFTALLTRIFSPEAARALFERWRKSNAAGNGLGDFLPWLVEQGRLTEFQASFIGRGETDRLFLGPFKLVDRLREGSDVETFKAERQPDGQAVVVEVLKVLKVLKDPKTPERFQRETRLLALLHHPAFFSMTGVGEQNGVCFRVFDYVEGVTLQELLEKRAKLPLRDSVRLAFLVALGLQHLHEKGFIHGRLTPGNLLLCPPTRAGESTLRSMVKLLNPALDRELLESESASETWAAAGGVRLDAGDYLAPEATRDIRADIYSLGCVLYHLLAGLPPFADKSFTQKRRRHDKEPPWPLRKVNAQIPEGLDQVVLKMLAKEPTGRFGTPMHAAEALKAFLAEPEQAKDSPEEPALLPAADGAAHAPRPGAEAVLDGNAAVPEGIPVDLKTNRGGAPAKSPPRPGPKSPFIDPLDADRLDVEPVTAIELAAEFFRFRSRDLFVLLTGVVLGGGLVALVWLIIALVSGGAEVLPSETTP